MYHVYLLRSEHHLKKLYVGFTSRKINERIKNRNYGDGVSTRNYRPWQLIYLETYISKKGARHREKMLKHHGSSWSHLKKRLTDTFKD